jgi:antitoxin component YwqK of YwqJK toxin-antitoxin module
MSSQRPAQVPQTAIFDEEQQLWEVGEKNEEGKRVGLWTSWRADGSKECEEEWGDGRTHLTYRRFHLDGSIAQSGAKDLGKDVWAGVMRWTRFEGESPENQFFPAKPNPDARVYELVFEDGWVVEEKVFDASGARITQGGAPFPTLPEGVSADAFLTNGDQLWLQQARSIDNVRRRGAYTTWDRNGAVQEKHVYEDGGSEQPLRREKYENGALWSVLERNGADQVQSFYRRARKGEGRGAPVLRSSTFYRGGNDDRETTYYDENGVRLFSIRLEEIEGPARWEERRYEDGKLVFEAIWNKEAPELPPEKVEYYGEGGELLIDYLPQGGGKGQWRLHRGGDVEVLATESEASHNQYGNWATFLPGFAHYDGDREKRDWEVVTEGFLSALEEHRFAERVAGLAIPAALAPVLGRIDWKTTRGSHRGSAIDKLIVLMLGEEVAAAERTRGEIWWLVEEQDCVFAATYAVAETMARLLPIVTDEAPRRRVLKLLAEIVGLPALADEDEDRYAEVIAAVREVTAELEAFVRITDDEDGRAVMALLSLLGAPTALRERLGDTSASVETRSVAACAFASCRERSADQRAEAVGQLRQAFEGEPDPGVKVVLGVLVRLLSGKEAPPAGVNEATLEASIEELLVYYLLRRDQQAKLFTAWRPVIRFLGDDVQSTLMRAVPARVRKQHMGAMLDRLPSRGSLDQAEDLDILFGTLFPEGAEQPLSPLRRRALRVAADLVDEHPGFVNHGEIFHKHSLPWDSFQLRELARTGELEGEAEEEQESDDDESDDEESDDDESDDDESDDDESDDDE